MKNFLQNSLLAFQYEEIVKDPLAAVHSMLTFLGQPVDPVRMACVAAHGEGQFHREGCKPGTENKTDIFSDNHKLVIDAAIDRLEDRVKKHAPYLKVNLDKYKSTVVSFC